MANPLEKPPVTEEALKHRLYQYQRLVEISRDLASTLNLDSLLRRIIQDAVELSQAQAASILLYEESTGQLYFRHATNLDDRLVGGISVPLDGSIAGWIVTQRQPVIVDDVHNDARFFPSIEKATHIPTANLVGVPLINQNRVLGVLEVVNKTRGMFTQDDLDILMVLAAQAATAIQNTRLFHQSDLISELVHELRTPLGSITSAAYLIDRPEISLEQQRDLAHSIQQESTRLNDLITSYLELARLESGRTLFETTRFELEPVIDECLQALASMAAENQVILIKEIAPNLPPLTADAVKIRQVLINLISNAVKYNQPGGKVFVRAYTITGEFILAVEDTGIGISPAARPHVFEKFYRSPEGEKVAPGTGLGLSICRHIVENQGGKIDVTSQPGSGSTFIVHLPLR